ncbi:hypothetical protein [Niallia sp.]|uniref:hypothetical protein n=1 Tax=Niallia sp. TaxID=2837523 RepID=UPI00289E0195|nr:hypothetical protein [Niallia sp.]
MDNKQFHLEVSPCGNLSKLILNKDAHQMNWVMDSPYLEKYGYDEKDKLFGNFSLTVNGERYMSTEATPIIIQDQKVIKLTYSFNLVEVTMDYDLEQSDCQLLWKINLKNRTDQVLTITHFHLWASVSYVMFRINDYQMQTNHSTAVYPSISGDYTKLACVRRSNLAPHLGIYQKKGRTLSVGTYCAYRNLFFESVSPSLDGLLFHQLVLAGGYPEHFENADWVYGKDALMLSASGEKEWEYALEPFSDQEDFYHNGLKNYGHPIFDFEPLAIVDKHYDFSFELPADAFCTDAYMEYLDKENQKQKATILPLIKQEGRKYQASLSFDMPGEHKITIEVNHTHSDSIILNVMEPIQKIIENRSNYISNTLFNGPESPVPYSYSPISNQGESLGKLSLVLKDNLLRETDVEEVQKVEASCVNYIRQKWFINGDFTKPAYLYGDFYRCMDFEYIAHVFLLLSQFDEEILKLHHPDTYLSWAADVFSLRVDPAMHDNERGKEEAQMLGVFFLYIDDLLAELKTRGLLEKYQHIQSLWSQIAEKVSFDSEKYKATVTEHFYDNAGFGPATGALASTGHLDAAKKYGELVIANIGFANDFRAQSPDRWWEALSYMIHSLWGGITAAASLKAYEKLKDTRFLKAAYRATVGILYCYDTNAKATNTKIAMGEAASTYSIAGPHVNRPDLSRNRFGQSTFFRDGGIFTRLFTKEEETADWDMGEELVAYLDGFGKKTYLYEEEGHIAVINGSIEETSEGLLITSYAPYPMEYHFYDLDVHYVSEKGKYTPQILFVDGEFKNKELISY